MKNAVLIILGIVLFASISIFTYTCNMVKENSTDKAFSSYEEFQEMYNTCQKLNTDLCNIKDVDEHDKMFEQFSKSQRITGIRQNMNRWIEEYNAKSNMRNKSMWKSQTLPYQLSTTDFKCY